MYAASNIGSLLALLAYPVLMIIIGTALISVMMVAVVPKVTSIFASLGQALPWYTATLIFVSDVVSSNETVGMLLTGLSLGTFDTVLILTGGGPGTATLTPALYSYGRAFVTNDWPLGAAISVGILVITISLLFLSEILEKRWAFK